MNNNLDNFYKQTLNEFLNLSDSIGRLRLKKGEQLSPAFSNIHKLRTLVTALVEEGFRIQKAMQTYIEQQKEKELSEIEKNNGNPL